MTVDLSCEAWMLAKWLGCADVPPSQKLNRDFSKPRKFVKKDSRRLECVLSVVEHSLLQGFT